MKLRKIDALVAEKIMGYEYDPTNKYMAPKNYRHPVHGTRVFDDELPKYCTDIKQAWEVVVKVASENFTEPEVIRIYGPLTDGYKATVIWEHHDGPIETVSVIADTAPMAICLVALASKGIKV